MKSAKRVAIERADRRLVDNPVQTSDGARRIGGDVNLSIKNAPDDLVERLRERAAKHHRSRQGELLAIIEEAVRPPARSTPSDVLSEVRRLGLETPADAVAIIRADRNDR